MKKSIKSVICLLLGAVMLFTAVLPTVYAFDDDPMNGRFGSGKREPLNEAQEEVVYTHDPRFDTGYTRVEMIDVSSHNGSIDWAAVAASGIRYAMIRAGYRGYGSDGILNADSRFRENVAGAIAAGIKVGAYFYTQAKSNAEAVAEADFTLSLVSGFDLKMPIVYDCEFAESGGRYTGRFYDANLSAYQIASMCNAFCSRVVSAGYGAMVYANPYMLTGKIDASSLQYPVWLASFSDSAKYSGSYIMWQYSSKETVPGITGNVDKSFYYIQDGTVPERFRVHTSKLDVYVGEYAQMSAFFDTEEYLDAGCRVGQVLWASTNEEVLTVDADGRVTANAVGQAYVSAYMVVSVPDSRTESGYADYPQQKTILLTVSEKPPEPEFSLPDLNLGDLNLGDGGYLSVIISLLSAFIKFIMSFLPMLTGGAAQ